MTAGIPATTVADAAAGDADALARIVGAHHDEIHLSIKAFHPESSSDYAWSLDLGQAQSLHIVQVDASTTFLLWYRGTTDEERAVLDSIRFLELLPTP